ncbi:MAG: ferrochelatase, partial [Oligoflexia bacterium]|nr:ferrochelatase [Oligoflexia bacterium]
SDRCAAVDVETLRWAEIERQARDLGRLLGGNYAVRPVLRYAGPSAAQAAMDLGPGERVVLLPLNAQVSGPTTISPLRHAALALRAHKGPVAQVQGYPDNPLYIDAIVETLREALLELPQGSGDYQVIFCARGLPGRLGPYPKQVAATVRAVVARSHLSRPYSLAYTRAPGLGRGPSPQVRNMVAKLGDQGQGCLVLVPIGFTSDHVETRVELDSELQITAKAHGVHTLVRAPTVATRPTFLRTLAALVHQAEDRAGWDVSWRQAQDGSTTPS